MEVLGHVADEDEEVASSHEEVASLHVVTRRARPNLLPQPPQRVETMVTSSLNGTKA